jgi:hypothetical protein
MGPAGGQVVEKATRRRKEEEGGKKRKGGERSMRREKMGCSREQIVVATAILASPRHWPCH